MTGYEKASGFLEEWISRCFNIKVIKLNFTIKRFYYKIIFNSLFSSVFIHLMPFLIILHKILTLVQNIPMIVLIKTH